MTHPAIAQLADVARHHRACRPPRLSASGTRTSGVRFSDVRPRIANASAPSRVTPSVDSPAWPMPRRGRRMTYQRRRPEAGTLHRVVRENLKTFYAATEDRHGGASLPSFVRKELEGYLDCGLLCRGFAVVACGACHERRLVAFGCHGRGFCPSCLGRRMAQTACNLLDDVL